MNPSWSEFEALIRPAQRIVISSHVRPDADAIGSGIALCGALEQLGKTVSIINPSPTPKKLAFLDPRQKIRQIGPGASEADYLAHDLHIIVDTSAWVQLSDVGKALQKSPQPKVVIDHHVSSDDLGAVDFKDTRCEATGTLIFRLAQHLGSTITPEIGNAMFSAIATDTGWFRFPATTSETYHIIAHLIDAGVKPYELYEKLYENYSIGRLKLSGRVLSRVAQTPDKHIAYTHVLWEDYGDTNSEPADTEDLVNECLAVSGTEGAVIFIEQPNRAVKVSFRSRVTFDISGVAEQFNGGGHRQAAGAMLPGPMAAAQDAVLTALQAALHTPPVG